LDHKIVILSIKSYKIEGRKGKQTSKTLEVNTHDFASVFKKFKNVAHKNEKDF